MDLEQNFDRQETIRIESSIDDNNRDSNSCKQVRGCFCSKQRIIHGTTQLLLICFVLAVLYSILGNEVLPGSEIFALFLLYVLAFVGGKLVGFIHLPPLLGMLIAGFLYRNLPFIPFYGDITVRWASVLRGSALVVILLKAGLGLDAEKLKKLKAAVLQLAFSPCIIETITIGVASFFFLALPWIWGMLLGFVISAVSPAVVVPSLLKLQEKGLGTNKGIPTLVIAAASVDDVLAITGFTIMLSISLSEGSWVWSLAKGILEPLAGFIFGLSCGCILWYLPSKESPKYKEKYILYWWNCSCYSEQASLDSCFELFSPHQRKIMKISGSQNTSNPESENFSDLVDLLSSSSGLLWGTSCDVYEQDI